MPYYRRAFVPGGTFFLTLITEGRAPILCDDQARPLLRAALSAARAARPFTLDAIVLLPEHLHLLCTLPRGDHNFSIRIASFKAQFTRAYLAAGGVERPRSASRLRHHRRGVWQRKFWEHTIRNKDDFNRHLNYIHYNPVKHGLALCPHLWPYSTFAQWVSREVYAMDWCCACDSRPVQAPAGFDRIAHDAGE
jgi:putative transposase